MTKPKPYTPESIERALVHHTKRGAVELYLKPGTDERAKWTVKVAGYDAVDLTERETWALCVGLAAADRAAQPRVLREIGKDLGPHVLRYSNADKVRTIAAGGGPVNVYERLEVYCPLCHCNKSGYRSCPNQIGEACTDSRCLCHDDDWET